MVGSLFIIEEVMEKELQDPRFNNLYKLVRERILDLGNEQINRLEDSLKNFEVESKLNSYVFKKDNHGN
jgi:ribosomal protein S13